MTPGTAADGRDLDACRDGECEVAIQAGDVLRFGDQVKADPKLDTLRVLNTGDRTATLMLPSGMMTSASGRIVLNQALSIEVGTSKGDRLAIRISKVG